MIQGEIGIITYVQRRLKMTMQLNIGDHISPQPGYTSIPRKYRASARWARTRAIRIAGNTPGANTYFSYLGRTLTQLLNDNTIWVNYATFGEYGQTNFVGGKEIAIGIRAFRIGRWTVLATLIHELAHVNGAPGRPSTFAEDAVYHCGLGSHHEHFTGTDDPKTPYDPRIEG
jgi:hypothetical protein